MMAINIPERATLPRFDMPFPSMGCNALMNEAAVEMWQWTDRFDLCPTPEVHEQVRQARPELWASLIYPAAELADLVLFCEWTVWSFVVDDMFDDGPQGRDPARCEEVIVRLIAVIDGKEAPAGPLEHALSDLWQRICSNRSAGWTKVFRRDTSGWLWTYYTEAADRASGHVPEVEEFSHHRRDAIAMRGFLDLYEIPARIDLPEAVRNLSGFIALRNAATDHIALYNDICSTQKEQEVGYYHNSVCLIQHHRGCSLQEAFEVANDMLAVYIERIQKAERQLTSQLKSIGAGSNVLADVEQCVHDYRMLVRGDFDYHLRAERYQTSRHDALPSHSRA